MSNCGNCGNKKSSVKTDNSSLKKKTFPTPKKLTFTKRRLDLL